MNNGSLDSVALADALTAGSRVVASNGAFRWTARIEDKDWLVIYKEKRQKLTSIAKHWGMPLEEQVAFLMNISCRWCLL